MRRFFELTRRFRRDDRGAFAVIFGLMAIVLIATSGAVVDFTRVQQARTRVQTALDAATLALQTQIKTQTEAQLKVKAQTILDQRLNDSAVTITVDTVTADIPAGKLNITADINVPTAFVQLVGIPSISAHMRSEVTQNSNDLEVSVALDTTGSMAGSKITALRDATNNLIDLVVKDVQTPTYSKMAIVPWSYGANAGTTYATAVRGPIRGPWTITGAAWKSSQATVSAVTKANPGVVTTSANHGLATGDYIYFSGISGMSQINNKIYQITKLTNTTFKLNSGTGFVNTSAYSTFNYNSGSGKASKCVLSTCEVKVTVSPDTTSHDATIDHRLTDGEYVYIENVSGMSQLNNNYYVIGSKTATTFVLTGAVGPTYSDYTSGGSSNCILYGCKYYYFQAADNNYKRFEVTTCTTERVSTHQYDDAAPTTQYLGLNYTSGGTPCIDEEIMPLTTSKSSLHALANSLSASGSTSGHLGLAWGWYMVAPNFAYLWPSASQPKAYGSANLVKAIILMTDGAFNSPYCNGVIAKNAGSGSGSNSTHSNCNAPNGTSQNQAEEICTKIKEAANKTILYTVGFQLGSDTNALNFLRDCATDPSHFYQADTAADLNAAFTDIAQNLSDLRVSK